LRAERQADGARTFKLIEAEPLQTGYGQDLYIKIMGAGKSMNRELSDAETLNAS
jgi:hypothetical protein